MVENESWVTPEQLVLPLVPVGEGKTDLLLAEREGEVLPEERARGSHLGLGASLSEEEKVEGGFTGRSVAPVAQRTLGQKKGAEWIGVGTSSQDLAGLVRALARASAARDLSASAAGVPA